MLNQISFKYKESEKQDNLFTPRHKKYTCTISYNGKHFSFPYQCNPDYINISKMDCLQAIILDMEAYDYNETLDNFMWEYGYQDIKTAKKIFDACKHTSKRLHEIFTFEELDTLAELTRD